MRKGANEQRNQVRVNSVGPEEIVDAKSIVRRVDA